MVRLPYVGYNWDIVPDVSSQEHRMIFLERRPRLICPLLRQLQALLRHPALLEELRPSLRRA
jgi:hypothetical protein